MTNTENDKQIPRPPRRADLTHYTRGDEPVSRNGTTTAVCGWRVNEHAGEIEHLAPTCPWCKAWLHERNHAS